MSFYSQNRPAYLNYGALGNVIAHELVHGFGLLGNTAYEDGEEKILWTNHTHEHFLAQAECLLENCNKIGIDNNFWMNCKDTFEESFADYVGVNLAFEAYRRLQRDIGEEKIFPG
ncbi:hypothetical protein NQ318_018962 [Aromia moschata]|uniref:Peptidase M13 C-terminal domain-containing protein n=1 Tax=Aromia moschata TaxID=1265417 RepID=A0AAV8ZGP0_9CUCU|nr:hypothetical protein NQ318_018962 [Aromia moschata]